MNKIELSLNSWKPLQTDRFCHATDGSIATQRTEVHMKYDSAYLYIRFWCYDNPYTTQNKLKRHNDNLYNQEVFELFIAPSETDPTNYLEFEINPNNAIWVGQVFNPSLGDGSGNKLTMVPYNEAQIKHNIKATSEEWSGEFAIPWKLIGELTDAYRINFYRIISRTSHENPDWVCAADTCDFTCWSSTMSGSTPAFHKPKKFGILNLV